MATTKVRYNQIKTGLPAGGDMNYNNVSLLLKMEGSDGSTTFIDSSSSNRTVTAHNGAAISTDQFKFGGSSAEFDGSNDFLTVPASSDFVMTGDYTIEGWFRADATSSDTLISQWPTGGGVASFSLWLYNGKLRWDTRPANNITYNLESTSTISTGTWYNFAIVRSGNTQNVFINGTLESSNTMTDTVGRADMGVDLGRIAHGADYFDGYIEELRITKNVARYTSNFSVPAAAFPAFESKEGKALRVGANGTIELES